MSPLDESTVRLKAVEERVLALEKLVKHEHRTKLSAIEEDIEALEEDAAAMKTTLSRLAGTSDANNLLLTTIVERLERVLEAVGAADDAGGG